METNQAEQTSHMPAQPQKEHQWLQKLVGEWTYETEAMMEPDQPPAKWTGTETVRSLGDSSFWRKGRVRCQTATLQQRS